MRMRVGSRLRVLATMCLLLSSAWVLALAQDEADLDLSAKQRVLPSIGPGLRAIRQGADGRIYVLASPSPGLLVFEAGGKQVLSINEVPPSAGTSNASQALLAFGEDCDVDAEGKIYIADRGANAVRVF